MFKLLAKNEITEWKVKITGASSGSVGAVETMITAKFKLISTKEFESLSKKGDVELLSQVLQGWSDIYDSESNVYEFNEDNKTQLLTVQYIVKALVLGYIQFLNGVEEKTIKK